MTEILNKIEADKKIEELAQPKNLKASAINTLVSAVNKNNYMEDNVVYDNFIQPQLKIQAVSNVILK